MVKERTGLHHPMESIITKGLSLEAAQYATSNVTPISNIYFDDTADALTKVRYQRNSWNIEQKYRRTNALNIQL